MKSAWASTSQKTVFRETTSCPFQVRADFTRVRGTISKALSAAEIEPGETEFNWSADAKALGLGTMISRVALSAHHMLSREKPSL